MLRDPDRKDKFQAKYLGPYSVLRRTRWGAYQLRDMSGDNLDRAVPADQLKLVSRKPRAIDLASRAYNVDEIVSHRGTSGNYEYEVKWTGFPMTSWEPAPSFLNDKTIDDYWKAHPELTYLLQLLVLNLKVVVVQRSINVVEESNGTLITTL